MKNELHKLLSLAITAEGRCEFKISNTDLEIICDWTNEEKKARFIKVNNGVYMIYYEYCVFKPAEQLASFMNTIFKAVCANFKDDLENKK